MTQLVLVNKKDKKIGLQEKKKAHLGEGQLHRAFTIFIFNSKNELLLQKRSKNKFLWPNFWEASCSSHPLPGEKQISAGRRRLKMELGFDTNLKSYGSFQYQINYKNIGAENEVCALLVGFYDDIVKPNKKEVSDIKWIKINKLKKDIKNNNYAPWLALAIKQYEKYK